MLLLSMSFLFCTEEDNEETGSSGRSDGRSGDGDACRGIVVTNLEAFERKMVLEVWLQCTLVRSRRSTLALGGATTMNRVGFAV